MAALLLIGLLTTCLVAAVSSQTCPDHRNNLYTSPCCEETFNMEEYFNSPGPCCKSADGKCYCEKPEIPSEGCELVTSTTANVATPTTANVATPTTANVAPATVANNCADHFDTLYTQECCETVNIEYEGGCCKSDDGKCYCDYIEVYYENCTKLATSTTANVETSTTANVETPTTANVATPTTANVATPTTANVETPTTANVVTPTTANVAPTTAKVIVSSSGGNEEECGSSFNTSYTQLCCNIINLGEYGDTKRCCLKGGACYCDPSLVDGPGCTTMGPVTTVTTSTSSPATVADNCDTRYDTLYTQDCCNNVINIEYDKTCCERGDGCYCNQTTVIEGNGCQPTFEETGSGTGPDPTTPSPGPAGRRKRSTKICPQPPRPTGWDSQPLQGCKDNGLIELCIIYTTTKRECCHAVNSHYPYYGNVVRITDWCWNKIDSKLGNNIRVEGTSLGQTFPFKRSSVKQVTSKNSVTTLELDAATQAYLDNIDQGKKCRNLACMANQTTYDQYVDPKQCFLISYGKNDTVENYSGTVKRVSVEPYIVLSYDEPDEDSCGNLEPKPTYNSQNQMDCYYSKQSDANCEMSDSDAPLFCRTKDTDEDMFVGYNVPITKCDPTKNTYLITLAI